MWGSGSHEVVNRVVAPVAAPPEGLTEIPVLGYQVIEEEEDPGAYLRLLPEFSLLGNHDVPGLIGVPPSDGYGAIDTAELILQVRGPLLCAPRAALITETTETITVAVYYGLPDRPADAPPPAEPIDNAVSCPAGNPVTASILLPIELMEEVGTRTVLALNGDEIPEIPLLER